MKHLRQLRFVDEIARASSIRKAAETLGIAPSALNRRLKDIEDDMRTPLFERLPRGVRLNAAGELLIRHVRRQLAEFEQVRNDIADLEGMRRGKVSIACSQAPAEGLVMAEIGRYRDAYPAVRFHVSVMDHAAALRALEAYETDLLLTLNQHPAPSLRPLVVVDQPLMAVMAADHPLAARSVLRLRDLVAYPLALPGRGFTGREILDEAAARMRMELTPVFEANSFDLLIAFVRGAPAVTFQFQVGTEPLALDETLAVRQIDSRDVKPVALVLAQLLGRTVSVATAKFAEQLSRRLNELADTGPAN